MVNFSDSDDEDEFPESPCIITKETEAVSDYPAWVPTARDTDLKLRNVWNVTPQIVSTGVCGNLIQLREDFCKTYRRGNWALVPELPVLKEIAIKALTFEHSAEAWPSYLASFPIMERAYKFVYFRGAPSVIVRFEDDANSYALHNKPFENFPSIQSSVHPYFAVANVAQKILRQRKDKIQLTEQPSDVQECLDLCIVIYRQWLSLSLKRPAPVDSSRSAGLSGFVKLKLSQSNRAPSSSQNQGRSKQSKRTLSESDSDSEPPANKSLRASR